MNKQIDMDMVEELTSGIFYIATADYYKNKKEEINLSLDEILEVEVNKEILDYVFDILFDSVVEINDETTNEITLLHPIRKIKQTEDNLKIVFSSDYVSFLNKNKKKN